jgi:hypothetical protein
MESDWIVLAHIWQRRGLMMMPPYIINALRHAFSLPADPPFGEAKPESLFRDRCLASGDSEHTKKIIDRVCEQGYPLYKPAYHLLTVSAIEVDIARFPDPAVRLARSASSLTTVWRWKYWYPAFTVFWAHIFHTENEWLRRPERIWQELELIRHHFLSSEGVADDYHYYLALYERILGVQYDIRTKAPHYLVNIPDRIELKYAERAERPALFAQAVNFLREQVEQILLNYQL